MCRLYAYLGSRATGVAHDLIGAPNALVRQSCRDREGETHADGWGIGYYAHNLPALERGTEPAYVDPRFRTVAQRVQSRVVLAHVRAASVGDRTLVNAHPFCQGRWLFAHNGTVTAFERICPVLEEETGRRFLAGRRGGTDSELVFCWFLKRMADAGHEPDLPINNLESLTRVLAGAVGDLCRRCTAAGAIEKPGLNFVLTDGSVVVACRSGRSLFSREQGGADLAIASEPPDAGPWQEIPDGILLAADDRRGVLPIVPVID
jgi:glutamine amidotransferase